MCLFTTRPTRTYHDSVIDPPRHSSRYSAHTAGVMRIPRDRRSSYRRSIEYIEEPRHSSRMIEYVEEPRRSSRSVFRERDVDYRASRGSFGERDVVRRSVSRVRY